MIEKEFDSMFQARKDLKPDTIVEIQYKTENEWVTHCTLPFSSELVGIAKSIALSTFNGTEYLDLKAWRVREFDNWCVSDKPYTVDTNEELPDGAPMFYSDL